MSESVGTLPQESEFVQTVRDPELRLEWIRERLGEEVYAEALALRQYRARLVAKTKADAR